MITAPKVVHAMHASSSSQHSAVCQQRAASSTNVVGHKTAQRLPQAARTLTSSTCEAWQRRNSRPKPHQMQARASCGARYQSLPEKHPETAVQRRHVLQQVVLAATAAALSGGAKPAQADLIRELVKGYVRPEVAADQAIMQLMDARGTLMELKTLAASPPNSQERFEARRVLPGMATRLRQVSSAAPVAAALASGTASEATLSYLYGGSAAEGVSELSMAIPVYEAIGKVITISGRTIRKTAQASPEYAEAAIESISKLLAACPQADLDRAQAMRQARTNVKAV